METGPAWEIARLFPHQGAWSEGDFLDLNRRTNRLVELADGHVEVLEMPTKTHQRIVLFLYNALLAFTKDAQLGEVLVAAYPVRLRPEKFREPDIVFMLAEHADRLGEDFAEGADLVMEVVRENRRRDLEVKVNEYAEAGIPEYWIVDPRDEKITVMTLADGRYGARGEFEAGQAAVSVLLPGFEVDVAVVFASGKGR
jgi:Uma2 family endonuclease